MKSAKDEVRDLLEVLPDDADFETIMSKILFRAQIRQGLDDIDNGRTVSQEEIEKEFGLWPESAGL
jgi:predicted transcriptional regulator